MERQETAAEVVSRSLLQLLSEAERSLGTGPVPHGIVRAQFAGGVGHVEPLGGLAWSPAPPVLREYATEPFILAEQDEIHNRNDGGRAQYVALSRDRDPAVRAGAWLRLARLERRAGRTEAALRAYRALVHINGVAINGTPADLLARRMVSNVLRASGRLEECAEEARLLWKQLHAGAWSLDRSSWELAVRDVEGCYRGTELNPERRAISVALDSYVQHPPGIEEGQRGHTVIFSEGVPITLVWRRDESSNDVVVVPPSRLNAWLEHKRNELPATVAVTVLTRQSQHVAGQLESPDIGDRERLSRRSGPETVVRSADETGLPWVVRVRTNAQSDMVGELAGRRRLLGGGLVALLLFVGGGSYFLWRVIQRELAVARLKTEFVAAVSHEFRTPLTSLRHVAELLQEDDEMPRERRQAFYSALVSSSERLNRLVESVLDFARIEGGRQPWRPQPMNVLALLESVITDFRKEHPTRVIELRPVAELPDVMIDAAAMTTAVWNLLDNAAKYSPRGSPILVSISHARQRVAITVTDYGVGIPPAERRAIFDRFVRGARATELGIAGTGLGLALVAHIVRAHGGTLSLASEEGEGSAFTMTFPDPCAAEGATLAGRSVGLHARDPHR